MEISEAEMGMEKKSNIFTLDVREAYRLNKNEVAKVLWDTLYKEYIPEAKFVLDMFTIFFVTSCYEHWTYSMNYNPCYY